MTQRRSLILALAATLALTLAPAATAHERDLPDVIELPAGFSPEGITSAFRHRLYVGSVANGAIWRGSAISGEGRILVPGEAGRQAAGLHVDWRGRLWVAGANNHTIRVYNALTGRLLQTYTFPTAGFINDLVITRRAVYATDSNNQQLAVVPLGRFGRLPDPDDASLLPLTGDLSYSAGFNANGIVAKDGWLILVQGNEGLLFRVDPRTGETKAINTGGYSVANGDGLVLRGDRLYVVRNQVETIAVLRLSDDLLSATLIGEIKDPDDLDVPTTGTLALGGLYVVNARFGVADPAAARYWITRLPATP